MTTPDEPQNPYGANPPQEPQQPAQPSYGAPQVPQAPQYGAPPAPQYGAPQAPQYGASPYPSAPQYGAEGYGVPSTAKNSLGVWALVLGILSVTICGLLTGIAAIIVGNNAKKAVARGEASNRGMATAGLVLGWIGTALSVILLIARVANS